MHILFDMSVSMGTCMYVCAYDSKLTIGMYLCLCIGTWTYLCGCVACVPICILYLNNSFTSPNLSGCRKENDLPYMAKCVHICLACKMSGGLERKKRNMAVLTHQFKIKHGCNSGICTFFKVNVLAKYKNSTCKRNKVRLVL